MTESEEGIVTRAETAKFRDAVAMEFFKIAIQHPECNSQLADAIAQAAYAYADAMVKARNG